MLSLTRRTVSRLTMRARTTAIYESSAKIARNTLDTNSNVAARCVSSWNPPVPPRDNSSSDDSLSNYTWEGSTLDAGPTIQDVEIDSSWVETAASQESMVTAVSTLQDLGLGSFTPVGIFQITLDSMHSAGLPWWATIVATTVVLRTATFPLMLQSQRATPEYIRMMTTMRDRTTELRKMSDSQDPAESQKAVELAQIEFEKFRKDYPRVSARQMLPGLVQAPIFVSFFLALTRMAWAPVESMKTGGLLWFPDLTVADPLYLLPVITCGTLSVVIEVGADPSMQLNTTKVMHRVVRIMPLVLLPFIMSYPAATLCYWSTNNFISLIQAHYLKRPEVREKLNLPPISAMAGISLENSQEGANKAKKDE